MSNINFSKDQTHFFKITAVAHCLTLIVISRENFNVYSEYFKIAQTEKFNNLVLIYYKSTHFCGVLISAIFAVNIKSQKTVPM